MKDKYRKESQLIVDGLIAAAMPPLIFGEVSLQGKKRFVDIACAKIGSLTVLGPDSSRHEKNSGGLQWFWHVHCGLCSRYCSLSGRLLRRGVYSSCGCKKSIIRLRKGEQAIRRMIDSYRKNAKDRNLAFNISRKYFTELIQKRCFYCGALPRVGKVGMAERDQFASNGIDRLDDGLGYSKSNCVPCCTSCNLMKQDFHVKEFLGRIELIAERRKL